ncbi:hypothetical protein GTY54_50370 [Streptomyces sp. SID625]|nr:hypothetical protein [Streptomyces sp. SID625]
MLAVPIVTLPTVIARHLCADLFSRPDPARHLLAAQLFPSSTRPTLPLPPRDLQDPLGVLLEISIDLSDGTLSPEACGFTEADIHEAIDLHQHHYGSLGLQTTCCPADARRRSPAVAGPCRRAGDATTTPGRPRMELRQLHAPADPGFRLSLDGTARFVHEGYTVSVQVRRATPEDALNYHDYEYDPDEVVMAGAVTLEGTDVGAAWAVANERDAHEMRGGPGKGPTRGR